ncbi:MAG: glycoside hydrolase family 20 zincin-like fold domain-containing protein [Armatimonadota bacterium]|nr:glycoside hydrolase family 20 zincin-like fold domain-containing protein [Armatimonadota bacterium]
MRWLFSSAVLLGLFVVPELIPSGAFGGTMVAAKPTITALYVGANWSPKSNVDDDVWLKAERHGGFRLVETNRPATQQTDVRVCYDRSALYIRFDCFEDRMDSLVTSFKNDGEPVWQDDSVELWISPYAVASRDKCYQFVVNADGVKTCLRADFTPHQCRWQAKTFKMSDRWVAILTIPYSALSPAGRNEDCWRVLFGRNERPHVETSSWPSVPRFFATFSNFARLVPSSSLFQFNTFRGKLAPIDPPVNTPTGLEPVTVPAKSPSRKAPLIIPEPQEVRVRVGVEPFVLSPATKIIIDSDAVEQDLWAVEELNDAIEQLGGKRLETVHAFAVSKDPSAVRDAIILGETSRNEVLQAVCQAENVWQPSSPWGTGAYVVDVTPSRVVLWGETRVETFYAVQTLKQLIRAAENGSLEVPAVVVRDYPRFRFRGVHLLAAKDGLQYIGKLIERVLAPFKVNHIVLQMDKVAWTTHPEVVDPQNYMPPDDVRRLVEIARRHHIAVTPLVQSPGHLEWAFRDKRNLEFAEDPEQPYCYCMSNPKSYEFIFSIMDEAIEMCGKPEYFHAGRDEFDMRGRMPFDEKCKAIGKERLYIQDTLRVYEHLKSRGCKMMMWGDVLVRPGFRELVDELPKDILINDWHYAPTETYPTVDFYISHGFPVVGCTWYDPRNIARFSRYASERDVLGMMQTTWTGFQPEEVVLRKWPEQAYGYVLSAAWSWNPKTADLAKLPYRGDVVFKKAWGELPPSQRGDYAVVRLDGYCNIARVDSARKIGWLGIGRGYDLGDLPSGLVSIEETPFCILPANRHSASVIMLGGVGVAQDLPSAVRGIQVGGRVKSLRFLHGCAYGAEGGCTVGRYVIHFEDGSTETIDLVCGNNIFAWDDQSTAATYGHAWKTLLRDKRVAGVGILKWDNPKPDVKVESFDFISELPEACPFLLAVTAEI